MVSESWLLFFVLFFFSSVTGILCSFLRTQAPYHGFPPCRGTAHPRGGGSRTLSQPHPCPQEQGVLWG